MNSLHFYLLSAQAISNQNSPICKLKVVTKSQDQTQTHTHTHGKCPAMHPIHCHRHWIWPSRNQKKAPHHHRVLKWKGKDQFHSRLQRNPNTRNTRLHDTRERPSRHFHKRNFPEILSTGTWKKSTTLVARSAPTQSSGSITQTTMNRSSSCSSSSPRSSLRSTLWRLEEELVDERNSLMRVTFLSMTCDVLLDCRKI